MEVGGGEIKIENSVEGPHQKINVTLSREQYEKEWNKKMGNSEGQDGYTWVLGQIQKQLPNGEIKKAIGLAIEDRLAAGNTLASPVIDEATKYAYRGVLRRSDGKPTWQHKEALLSNVDDNLHRYGIENPNSKSAINILQAKVWDYHSIPKPDDIKDGIDIGVIMVYKNTPFVLPTEDGQTETTLINLSAPKGFDRELQISVDEARLKRYPTLRDNFLGQIEVQFVSTKTDFFSRFLKK